MNSLIETRVFNSKDTLIEGWYWLLRSSELKKGGTRAVTFFGRDLVVYRGESGTVHALDAYCPHMGAHLAEGCVQGESVRCLFHGWKFGPTGKCTEIPCQEPTQFVPRLGRWPLEERYGLIWIWTGPTPAHPVPFVPELRGEETSALLGSKFTKNCHPNVVMINAIDAQHFNTVHPLVKQLTGDMHLEPTVINENCIEFKNNKPVPKDSWIGRFLSLFYAKQGTYWMSYWYGSTGSVTLGPDFLHFHIIFALRPTLEGTAEGQTLLVTRKRPGFMGWLFTQVLLQITRVVGNYFAKGDTQIFKTIKFKMRAPVKADHAIIRFIQHVEQQKISSLQGIVTEEVAQ